MPFGLLIAAKIVPFFDTAKFYREKMREMLLSQVGNTIVTQMMLFCSRIEK